METGQQKPPPTVTQSSNTKGSNGHVAEVFETTGEEDRDSFEEQCQEKVQTKKNAAKARGAKRSSIIVAVSGEELDVTSNFYTLSYVCIIDFRLSLQWFVPKPSGRIG